VGPCKDPGTAHSTTAPLRPSRLLPADRFVFANDMRGAVAIQWWRAAGGAPSYMVTGMGDPWG